MMSDEEASRRDIEPLGAFKGWAVAGCEPDEMGIGPIYAVPKLLKRHGLTVDDIDIWELNEAFASQCLYSRDQLGIDPEKYNVNGGSIAIGHPFGMTGTRCAGHILQEGKRPRRQARRGHDVYRWRPRRCPASSRSTDLPSVFVSLLQALCVGSSRKRRSSSRLRSFEAVLDGCPPVGSFSGPSCALERERAGGAVARPVGRPQFPWEVRVDEWKSAPRIDEFDELTRRCRAFRSGQVDRVERGMSRTRGPVHPEARRDQQRRADRRHRSWSIGRARRRRPRGRTRSRLPRLHVPPVARSRCPGPTCRTRPIRAAPRAAIADVAGPRERWRATRARHRPFAAAGTEVVDPLCHRGSAGRCPVGELPSALAANSLGNDPTLCAQPTDGLAGSLVLDADEPECGDQRLGPCSSPAGRINSPKIVIRRSDALDAPTSPSWRRPSTGANGARSALAGSTFYILGCVAK